MHRALEDRADLDCRSMAIWTAIGEVKGWERRRVNDVQTLENTLTSGVNPNTENTRFAGTQSYKYRDN